MRSSPEKGVVLRRVSPNLNFSARLDLPSALLVRACK